MPTAPAATGGRVLSKAPMATGMISFLVNCSAKSRYSCCSSVTVKLRPIDWLAVAAWGALDRLLAPGFAALESSLVTVVDVIVENWEVDEGRPPFSAAIAARLSPC